MIPQNSYVTAVRAVLAVFLRRTIGRLFIAILLLTGFIGLLASYIAWRGMSLLWIIATIMLLIAAASGISTVIIYAITAKLLPRRLSKAEYKTVSDFTGTLQKRLLLLKVPLPVFIWNLLMQLIIDARESKEQKRVQSIIDSSNSLSSQFNDIKNRLAKADWR